MTSDRAAPGTPVHAAAPVSRTAAPAQEYVYRVAPEAEVAGTHRRRGLDVPATLAGALAALGALLLLSTLVGAGIGTIGYQSDVRGSDLSLGGLIGGLVVLALACVVGGWVAGRTARRQGRRHGLVAIAWLVVLAAVLAALAVVFGDDFDVRDAVGLPAWFSGGSDRLAAILTGLLAAAIMLLAGLLGGLWGARRRDVEGVRLVTTRRRVRTEPGGLDWAEEQ